MQIDVHDIRVHKYNRAAILDQLRLHGPLVRAGLAKNTGLPRISVSRIIDQFLNENLVHETDAQQARSDRRGSLIELNSGGGTAVGVELGVGYISVILTDFIAQILWRRNVCLPNEANLLTYLETSEELVRTAITVSISSGYRPLGIGVGVRGLVDILEGRVRFAPDLNWRDVPLKKVWEDRFGLTVLVENDANAAATGEFYLGSPEHAKNVDDFIYLRTGIGLGGAIIKAGKLFRGWNGYASQIGHMVIDLDGEPCRCGKPGCWETYVGSRVAVRNYEARTGELVSFDELIRRLSVNDPDSLEIFKNMAIALGIGIGNLVSIFNPCCIVVGGDLDQISENILPIARDTFSKSGVFPSFENVKIVPPALGADGCVLGCAILALNEAVRLGGIL